MPRPIKARNGRSIPIPTGEICRLICCDCGLVHDFRIEPASGARVAITFYRNNERTKKIRKKKKRK